MEDRSERELYYSHRLKLSEEILSRVFCKPVSLVVVGGWVRFNGKNYRVPQIEAHALYLDACMKESENEV